MEEKNLSQKTEKRTISTKDWLLDGVRNFCERNSTWFTSHAGAFLSGMFLNAYSDPSILNTWELLNRLFNVYTRPLNVLPWIAVVVILFFLAGTRLLKWYSRKRRYETLLAKLYRDKIDLFLQPFQKGRIGWGSCLTLQSSPDLHRGWTLKEVRIQHDPTQYVLPNDVKRPYEEYASTVFRSKYAEDPTNLMLVYDPFAFSDVPTLQLQVQETKWSQVQFYHKWFRNDTNKRVEHINQVLQTRQITFPNTLCLHLVIATADGYILRTRISPKVEYYPSMWSCSIAEQLKVEDLKGPEGSFVLNWVKRALWEELGVLGDGFSPENVRVMAVFLEGDIVNFALATIVVLNHNRTTLDAIIDKHPRTDYEFNDWDFISWDDIPNELLRLTKIYHPCTGIKMFYAGLYKFGAPELNRQLMSLKKEE